VLPLGSATGPSGEVRIVVDPAAFTAVTSTASRRETSAATGT
jgi:hypothetical protein